MRTRPAPAPTRPSAARATPTSSRARTRSSSAASTTCSTRGTARPSATVPRTTARPRGRRATARRIDQRAAQEEPEVWEQRPRITGDREELRAGRLVEDDSAVDAGGTDSFAIDAGVSGGAASAEEAAIHLIEEEYVDEDRDRDDD